jgi:hypothetical protein
MAGTLAVDPTTGDVWWADYPSIRYRDAVSGQIHVVPDPDPAGVFHLAFDQEGVLYAHTRQVGPGNLDWLHRLYKREDDTWSLLFTATGPTMSFDAFTVCPDGGEYIFGAIDATQLPCLPDRSGYVYSAWRLKDDGTLQLLATDTGVDHLLATCDPLTGDIYYPHNKGIARFYWWATHFVHLPLVLKDFGP